MIFARVRRSRIAATLPVLAATIALLSLFVAGCARTPAAVGTWTTTVMNQPLTMVLKEDGTGTLTASTGTQPVKWSEDKEGKLSLAFSLPGGAPGSTINVNPTFSEDKKTMTITGQMGSLAFQKQADK
jgi:hypothetical protein